MRLGSPGRRSPAGRTPGRRTPGARPIRRRGFRFPRFGLRRRLTPTRAAAILGLLVAGAAIYGVAGTPAFTLTRTEIPDLRWTTRDALLAAVGIPDGANLFRLRVAPIEARLRTLPGVATARVTVSLPDTLVIEIGERQAILAWAVDERRFLVDRDGVLFATTTTEAVVTAHLPAIGDSRDGAASLEVGSRLDPIDLDAATRLGSLVPDKIDSVATSLVIEVTTANGFVMGTVPRSWVAIFGLYTPSIRTPAIIPGQVRLLRSLLFGRESAIERVFLPDEDSGTFTLKPTPAP